MLGKFEELIEKASEMELKAFFVDAKDIPIENRIVALKCAYGCNDYGKSLSCPPHVM
jgi:predicted metal-binding protein